MGLSIYYPRTGDEEEFGAGGEGASEKARTLSGTRAEDRDVENERKSASRGPNRAAKRSPRALRPNCKDLIERLLEKGLLPMAALDVIRGLLILEMSTTSEEDKRLIRAATRNKLGYHDVRNALLSMYDDAKPGRGSFHGHGGKGFFPAEHWNVDTENVNENESGNLLDEGYGENPPV